jgi:hypothetical protein
MAKNSRWRMPDKCDTCPFHETGPGRQLRDSLAPGRFAEIKRALLNEEIFFCHKHARYTDEEHAGGYYCKRTPGDRVCAGAIEFQERHDCVPQAVQVYSRLDKMRKA